MSRYFLSSLLFRFLSFCLSFVTHSVFITHCPGPKQAVLVCSNPHTLTLSLALPPFSCCFSPSPSRPGSLFRLLFFTHFFSLPSSFVFFLNTVFYLLLSFCRTFLTFCFSLSSFSVSLYKQQKQTYRYSQGFRTCPWCPVHAVSMREHSRNVTYYTH